MCGCAKKTCVVPNPGGVREKTIMLVFLKMSGCEILFANPFANIRFECKNDKTSILFKESVYFNTYAFQFLTKCTFFCKIVKSRLLFIQKTFPLY